MTVGGLAVATIFFIIEVAYRHFVTFTKSKRNVSPVKGENRALEKGQDENIIYYVHGQYYEIIFNETGFVTAFKSEVKKCLTEGKNNQKTCY